MILTRTVWVLLSVMAGAVLVCTLCAVEAYVLMRRAKLLIGYGQQLLGAAERLLAQVPSRSAAPDRPRPKPTPAPAAQPPPQVARPAQYGKHHTRPDPMPRRDLPRA